MITTPMLAFRLRGVGVGLRVGTRIWGPYLDSKTYAANVTDYGLKWWSFARLGFRGLGFGGLGV